VKVLDGSELSSAASAPSEDLEEEEEEFLLELRGVLGAEEPKADTGFFSPLEADEPSLDFLPNENELPVDLWKPPNPVLFPNVDSDRRKRGEDRRRGERGRERGDGDGRKAEVSSGRDREGCTQEIQQIWMSQDTSNDTYSKKLKRKGKRRKHPRSC